jgi:anti-sigma regulatory factor (Ser/Thr protein kinase)
VDQIVFEVEDQGPGFDPVRIPDATAYENLQRPSGRGLLLIRHFAAWVSHNRKGNGIAFCICPSEPLLARQAVQPLLAVAN